MIAGEPSLFEPGSSWAYSSTNYLLLGLVIEGVTGNSYATEVARRIPHPLDLHDTELPGADPHITGAAKDEAEKEAGRSLSLSLPGSTVTSATGSTPS